MSAFLIQSLRRGRAALRPANPIAKALRSPHVKQRIVPSGKVYRRKPRTSKGGQ